MPLSVEPSATSTLCHTDYSNPLLIDVHDPAVAPHDSRVQPNGPHPPIEVCPSDAGLIVCHHSIARDHGGPEEEDELEPRTFRRRDRRQM